MTAISLNLTRSDGELQEFHLDSGDAEVVLEALRSHHDGKGKKKPPAMEDEEMDEEEMMDSDDDEEDEEWTTEDRDDSDDEDESEDYDDDSEGYYEDSEDEEYEEDHTDSDLADLQERIDYLGSMMGMGEMDEPDGDEMDYDEIAEDAVESYKSMMASAYKATMDYLPADMNPFETDDPIELYVAAIEEMEPSADLEGKSYERIMGMFDVLVLGEKTDADDLDSTSPIGALAKASLKSGGSNGRTDAAYEEVKNMYENAWKGGSL